jgi:hypothetical protein
MTSIFPLFLFVEEGFQCKHVIPIVRETLHNIFFSDISNISDSEMCEINWVLVKEWKFYFELCKDQDFFEVDKYFVHKINEEDLNSLV